MSGLIAANKVVELTEPIINSATTGISNQIKGFFSSGEVTHIIRFDPPLSASNDGTLIEARSFPGLEEAGLEWFKVIKDDGLIYKYSFSCSNTKSCIIYVTDGEPDTYTLSMPRLGKHNCDYNSKSPNIKSIAFRKW